MKDANRYASYTTDRNFVAPIGPRERPSLPVSLVEPQQVIPAEIAAVWAAQDGAAEQTSATDRARAVILHSLPNLGLVALLSLAGAIVVGLVAQHVVPALLTFLLAMALVGSWVYRQESRIEYAYSRAGLERHRIDRAAELRLVEMEYAAELRRTALNAYLKMLEVDDE